MTPRLYRPPILPDQMYYVWSSTPTTDDAILAHPGGADPRVKTLTAVLTESTDEDEARESGSGCPGSNESKFLALPSELIDAILAFLSPYDLLPLSATCQQLRAHALSNLHWQALVQERVPGCKVRSSYPYESFCELYAAHNKVWFLPKFKIWFCDRDMTGKIVLARYDQRRGCIEGLQLVAVRRGEPTFQFWEENDDVVIHEFAPRVQLHLENPVLQFNVGDASPRPSASIPRLDNSFANEIPMMLTERTQHMYSNFILNKPLDEEETRQRLLTDYPYGHIWPPPSIPAHHHILGDGRLTADSRPYRRSQVSDQTFRIRQWLQSSGSVGLRIGDRISAYSTLDSVLYTPTPTKPWRGIWVGDYSGHGCEFILVHQPDDPPATDAELNLVQGAYETDEQWEQRKLEARIYRGRLEGIKLTGDPNVPRGEYTFIADDLGPEGFIGTAEREPFTGTRIVSSKGHVAATGFRDGTSLLCMLLLNP